MDITPYKSYSTLTAELDSPYSIFLSGSDQIWNPLLCDPVFFLDFVKEGKCISYAASMGNTHMSAEASEKITNMLKKYSRISVREQACLEALQGLVDTPISVNIDPTFLVNTSDWRHLETKYPLSEPYILLYILYWDDKYRQQIQELKRNTGLRTVAIVNQLPHIFADQYLFDVGLKNFCGWLIMQNML